MAAAETRKQTVRYLTIGALCAAANNALLIAGARAGLGVLVLTLLSVMSIGSFAYVAHARFTFRQIASWRSYRRFMAGTALGVPVAYAVLALLYDILHLPMTIAAPTATIVLLVYNFLSARFAIMRRLLG